MGEFMAYVRKDVFDTMDKDEQIAALLRLVEELRAEMFVLQALLMGK